MTCQKIIISIFWIQQILIKGANCASVQQITSSTVTSLLMLQKSSSLEKNRGLIVQISIRRMTTSSHAEIHRNQEACQRNCHQREIRTSAYVLCHTRYTNNSFHLRCDTMTFSILKRRKTNIFKGEMPIYRTSPEIIMRVCFTREKIDGYQNFQLQPFFAMISFLVSRLSFIITSIFYKTYVILIL